MFGPHVAAEQPRVARGRLQPPLDACYVVT
jgi:hypothetical protein